MRLVYNKALEARSSAWVQEARRIGYAESSALLTAPEADRGVWVPERGFVCALQQALRHLQAGFVNFWAKRAGYPKFKSRRKSRCSAEYTRSGFTFRGGVLRLAKMAGSLDVVWSRPLPEGAAPSTVTVSRDSAGRWFVAMLCEDASVRPLPPAPSPVVGLDVGITALVAVSTGEKVENPRFEKQDRERLARAQRELAGKQKGSRNRDKARVKVARVHARIADRRRDHLHKLSTRLVRENTVAIQPVVVIEDLAVRNMLGNHTLARAISDAAWSELRRQLEYKCAWYGRDLVVLDRFYPSSKTCSACGHRIAELPLGMRSWTCDVCGATHDRDGCVHYRRAARNLEAAGLAVIACGAGVRPQGKPPGGHSAMKQETPLATVGIPAL